jgi:hypothetical protein
MSLELIDNLLNDWVNPEYEGFTDLTLHKFNFPNVGSITSHKIVNDKENSKYTYPNINDIGDELLEYYRDFGIKPSMPGKHLKLNYHRMMYTTFYKWPTLLAKFMNPSSEYILELGFTGGFTTLHMLKNTRSYVITIDKMSFDYHFHGKNFIDAKYPGRHTLIVGSPNNSVNYFEEHFNNIKFGLIYINKSKIADHIYNYIVNYKKFAHEDTIIFLKGTTPHATWGIGAYIAMNRAISEGIVIFIDNFLLEDNYYVSASLLKYNFNKDYKQKIPLKKYIEMERKIPLYEFLDFIKLDYENKRGLVTPELVNKYQTKFKKFNIELDEPIKIYLKDKFNIDIN